MADDRAAAAPGAATTEAEAASAAADVGRPDHSWAWLAGSCVWLLVWGVLTFCFAVPVGGTAGWLLACALGGCAAAIAGGVMVLQSAAWPRYGKPRDETLVFRAAGIVSIAAGVLFWTGYGVRSADLELYVLLGYCAVMAGLCTVGFAGSPRLRWLGFTIGALVVVVVPGVLILQLTLRDDFYPWMTWGAGIIAFLYGVPTTSIAVAIGIAGRRQARDPAGAE